MNTLSFIKGELIEKDSQVFKLIGGNTEYYNWVYPLQCYDEFYNSSLIGLKVVKSFEITLYDNFFIIG